MKRIITAAALAAALLAGAPRAAAVCPYTVGPLGRYIAPAVVQGMTATDDGNAVEVWCTDALDGDDWFFTVDNETDLRIFDRVQLVVDAAGTPDDFALLMPCIVTIATGSTIERKERTKCITRLFT